MGVLAKGTRVVLFVLVCSLIPAGVFGQAISTGTVQGMVTDPAGATVTDATVTLSDTATSTTRTAVTNDTGRYIFSNVPPGVYDVSVSKAGFRVTKFPKQEVTVGATLTLNIKLEIGFKRGNGRSYATGATLETMNATVGNTLTGVALGLPAGLGTRREHVRHAAARRCPRRQRSRSEPGPKFVHAGWRQQLQRHGRHAEYVHGQFRQRPHGWPGKRPGHRDGPWWQPGRRWSDRRDADSGGQY